MNKAAKLVSSAIIGTDVEVVVINGRQYVIMPPTIHKISGAISCLCELDVPDKPTVKDILLSLVDLDACAKALSWFVNGDESLSDELRRGTPDEVVCGLEKAVSMVSVSAFLSAVNLAKNVASLAAKQKS